MPRSTGRARAAFGKLVDTLHDSVKHVVDVHGRSLLVVNSDCFPAYLPACAEASAGRPERRRQIRRKADLDVRQDARRVSARDGANQSVGRLLNFFRVCSHGPYLPERFQVCRISCKIRVARRIADVIYVE
ncbi:MAG: hypothetical protein JXC33_07055 [Deltaproteobacteria bacterium]|nr:hypothetical protein [Deltaproteobacteria bacterium]